MYLPSDYLSYLKNHCSLVKFQQTGKGHWEPMLFNIFVDNTDSGTVCTLSRLAENTKPCGVVNLLQGKDVIQRNLDRLKRWASTNFM